MQPEEIDYKQEILSAQTVRLFDVFLIGPLLIIIGFLKSLPLLARIVLILFGVATILYNGYFYFKYRNLNS